jgi:hypothetical protein
MCALNKMAGAIRIVALHNGLRTILEVFKTDLLVQAAGVWLGLFRSPVTRQKISFKFVDYSELTLIRFVRSPNNSGAGPESEPLMEVLLEVSRDIPKSI